MRDRDRMQQGSPPENETEKRQQSRKVKRMKVITFGVTAAILVIVVCATGLVSAMPPPIQPEQPPVVQIPPTPTPTAVPTRPPIIGPPIVVEPPIAEPPPVTTVTPTPTATPNQTPTQTATPNATVTATSNQTPTATPTQTATPTPAQTSPPTALPQRPSPPTITPPQSPTTQPLQSVPTGAATQVSSGPADKMFPAISGDNILWVLNDSQNESLSVELYSISSENTSTISNATSVPLGVPHQLAIAESNAVWSGQDPGTGDISIYLYDISSGGLQQVTDESGGTQLDPGASQGYIIWTNLTTGSSDVYLYAIANESTIPVVTDNSYQMETAIGGNTTAWADNATESGDFNIVVAPVGESEGTSLGGSGDDRYPDVSSDGRYVAWIGFLGNRSAVYLYDVEEDNTTEITGESDLPDSVAVDGNLVVYSDLRSGNHDIYMYNITTGMESPVTQDQYDQSYPDVSNGEIVWMGNNTGRWEVYRVSAGG